MKMNPNERGFDIVIIIAFDKVEYIFSKEVHGQTCPPYSYGGGSWQ
jgi:hypothetical protein